VRGAPDEASTYESLAPGESLAIIDMSDTRRATAIAEAIHAALPSAEALVLAHDHERPPGTPRAGITWMDEGQILSDAIELVLDRARARKRVRALRRSLRGEARCTFLVQDDPDPDAIAASMALRRALDLSPDEAPIATCGRITRPENRRMIAELGVRIERRTRDELAADGALVLVDVQPPYFDDALGEVAAVIDHHPQVSRFRARYRDVRTTYGASATIAAEYLMAQNDGAITERLATALLYGIVTDTRSLTRHTSEADLSMFALLFPRADHSVLRRIQHPSYSPLSLRRLGLGLQRPSVRNGLAYVHLGRLPAGEEHVVAQFAEFCLGMAGAEVSAVSASLGSRVVMSTRAISEGARLGDRLRGAFAEYGSAGGHPIMAKAVIKRSKWFSDHPRGDEAVLGRQIAAALRAALAREPK
jgi:nanoRNase/pAp phosphatase (c-di-AMP/oligoRNAs hydrolase)